MGKKDTKSEHYKRAASNLMMTNESERELLRPEPTESLFNPDDWDGMTEEEAFEEYSGEFPESFRPPAEMFPTGNLSSPAAVLIGLVHVGKLGNASDFLGALRAPNSPHV